MAEVEELIAQLPLDRRMRERSQHGLGVLKANTYSTWRPGVCALAMIIANGIARPICFHRYATEEA
eukprot:9136171-Prorocentrum_lima.AAC.1